MTITTPYDTLPITIDGTYRFDSIPTGQGKLVIKIFRGQPWVYVGGAPWAPFAKWMELEGAGWYFLNI